MAGFPGSVEAVIFTGGVFDFGDCGALLMVGMC
jgi:hypothetical protein